MIVPPILNSKERREFDLCDLKVYYMICEELGIADDENIQKSFFHLMKWAGDHKFLEEFFIFKEHVDKYRENKKIKASN